MQWPYWSRHVPSIVTSTSSIVASTSSMVAWPWTSSHDNWHMARPIEPRHVDIVNRRVVIVNRCVDIINRCVNVPRKTGICTNLGLPCTNPEFQVCRTNLESRDVRRRSDEGRLEKRLSSSSNPTTRLSKQLQKLQII